MSYALLVVRSPVRHTLFSCGSNAGRSAICSPLKLPVGPESSSRDVVLLAAADFALSHCNTAGSKRQKWPLLLGRLPPLAPASTGMTEQKCYGPWAHT
jgi:hypothetical protein